jgi:protein-disulfide isomerase
VKKLQADMKDPEIQAIIMKNRNLADELGIDGTPALFVGNTFVPGAIQKDHLVELIADARK